MKYQEQHLRRVFSIQLSEGDYVLNCVEKLVVEKGIRAGIVVVMGSFTKGDLVLGYRKHSKKAEDLDQCGFDKSRVTMGIGTITWLEGKPEIRVHVGVAKEREVFLAYLTEACVGHADVFILELGSSSLTKKDMT